MDSSQDKSLPATDRKLTKTPSYGQGSPSLDLAHLSILGTGALMMLMGAEPLIQHLRMALAQQLAFDAHTAKTPALMMERMLSMGSLGLKISLVVAAVTTGAALVSGMLAGGWILSLKPIQPQFNRLNPLSGLDRKSVV